MSDIKGVSLETFEAALRRIETLERDVRNARGVGVTVVRGPLGSGVTIHAVPSRRMAPSQAESQSFWARISGNTQDGSNLRWAYTFVEVERTASGHNGWSDKSGGKTGTAYNINEDQNGATGTFGNGVASTNLTGTFALKPIPTGTRVRIDVTHLSDGTECYEIANLPNGVDGACA